MGCFSSLVCIRSIDGPSSSLRLNFIFIWLGNDFRGFHIRFRDVARGGIRIVMSRNRENYSINQRQLFDENYNLASTQALKNKDIPENGAKGTILPSYAAVTFFSFVALFTSFSQPRCDASAMLREIRRCAFIFLPFSAYIFTVAFVVSPLLTSSSLDKHPESRNPWLICTASLSYCSSVLMVRGDHS
jgi:hypothetical protein